MTDKRDTDATPITDHAVYAAGNAAAQTAAINTAAHEAGLQIMNADTGVLGVVMDREEVSLGVLATLTPADITDLYCAFIGPAIDELVACITTDNSLHSDHNTDSDKD